MLIYIIIFLVSFILTWLYRKYAIRKSFLDVPNNRSSHTVPTPRGGGIAIVISWFGGLCWLYFTNKIDPKLFFAFICGTPLVIISFLDDLMTLKPGIRFLFQFITAFSALYFLGGLQQLNLGFYTFEGKIILSVIALVAIIWSINLFNFLDGIDGYIGSEIVFLALTFFLLLGNMAGLLLGVSTLGFLLWNWPKAKIFMGDVGSTLMGFNVAIFAIWHQNTQNISIFVFLMLTGPFWYDATITLYRRWRNHEKLSEAHRKHAYQRLVQSGYSHKQVTTGLIFVSLFILLLVYLALKFTEATLLIFIITLFILWGLMRFTDKKKNFEQD